MCLKPRYVLFLLLILFLIILTDTDTLCRLMKVAGPEKAERGRDSRCYMYWVPGMFFIIIKPFKMYWYLFRLEWPHEWRLQGQRGPKWWGTWDTLCLVSPVCIFFVLNNIFNTIFRLDWPYQWPGRQDALCLCPWYVLYIFLINMYLK